MGELIVPAAPELWTPPSGLREKCAVVAITGPNAAEEAALALSALDHRGRDSSGIGGITSAHDYELFRRSGPAHNTYTPEARAYLRSLGLVALIGHDRYATSGAADKHAQPVEAGEGDKKIYFAQNGNLSNLNPLLRYLRERNIDPGDANDTEIAAYAFAEEYKRGMSMVETARAIFPRLVGAHCTVVCGKAADGSPEVVAFRDAHGVRPLSLGRTQDGHFMVASETVGLDAAGATFIRDVEPGELVHITEDGLESHQLAEPNPHYDLLDLSYLSHPDSLFKNVRIGDIRQAWGAQLAREFGDVHPDTLVVGMPSSGLEYAMGFARELRLEFSPNAITKILDDRSFMQPNQDQRNTVSDSKYDYNRPIIKGRRMIVNDDTIVRGTTAPRSTAKMHEAGAASVSWGICAPTILYPNFYGIDLARQMELMAARHKNNIESMRREIKCERLVHLALQSMLGVVSEMTRVPVSHFETSIFDANYPIDIDNQEIEIFPPHRDRHPALV